MNFNGKRGPGRPRKDDLEAKKEDAYKRMEKETPSNVPAWLTNPGSVPVETPPPLPYKIKA